MTTIHAKVNPRLLGKAGRMFTGSLPGRITEILQNARRAGARNVTITNHDGTVTVRDDGQGILDFQTLLDLGGSGWNQATEASEDPAGVGLFCLSPRPLTVRSRGSKVVIGTDGWVGAPVEIQDDPEVIGGSELCFADVPWSMEFVDRLAVFSGLKVTVDGEPCAKAPFMEGAAADYPELGCRIQVARELTERHRLALRQNGYSYDYNALLNFHGQTIGLAYHPVSDSPLHFLIEMTGALTGIRLMLPARTCLVENDAFAQLKAAVEREAFLFIQRAGSHTLPYTEYLRAGALGISLPEAQPVYRVGLLFGDMPEPVTVEMPPGFALQQCYRFDDRQPGEEDDEFDEGDEADEANAHLLAALGTCETPFVPVTIAPAYEDYSWAKLPTIGKVTVLAGKELLRTSVWSGDVACVESLSITAQCRDGKSFKSAGCMAIRPNSMGRDDVWGQDNVLVTPAARSDVSDDALWYHLGGDNDDSDTYDTQAFEFGKDLTEFWRQLVGPYEGARADLMEAARQLPAGWKSATLHPDGKVVVRLKNKRDKTLSPPAASEC